jgi:hypothetical protein
MKGKKKNKVMITSTHHLLDNKWRSALEAKVEAMGAKVESMSNSLLHIKELLLNNVDNGTKDTPLPMQDLPNIGLNVIEDLVHSRGDLQVNLKDMACILVPRLRALE